MTNLTAYDRFGWKLYNDEHSMWAWCETELAALTRVAWEHKLYGREFRIAKVTEREYRAYGRLCEARA